MKVKSVVLLVVRRPNVFVISSFQAESFGLKLKSGNGQSMLARNRHRNHRGQGPANTSESCNQLLVLHDFPPAHHPSLHKRPLNKSYPVSQVRGILGALFGDLPLPSELQLHW